MSGELKLFKIVEDTELVIPYGGKLACGFPSPADDFVEAGIDLNKELNKHPAATVIFTASGNSLKNLGIEDGDFVIVDKSLEPKNGKVAACYLDGGFTAKTIQIEKDHLLLLPANDEYKTIKVTEDNDFIIWGIVTYVIKKL